MEVAKSVRKSCHNHLHVRCLVPPPPQVPEPLDPPPAAPQRSWGVWRHAILVALWVCLPAAALMAEPASALPPDLALLQGTIQGQEPLTYAQRYSKWQEFAGSQHPIISRDDLKTVVTAQRAALNTVSLTYEVKSQSGKGQEVVRRVQFMSSGNRLYSNIRQGSSPDTLGVPAVISYDGKAVRTLETPEKGLSSGTVSTLQSRTQFFDFNNVLGSAMMLDSTRDLGVKMLSHDLVALLEMPTTTVLEQRQPVGGIDALVVTDGQDRVYLDPDRDFAVLRVEKWRIVNDADGRPTSLEQSYVRNQTELQDCGNGLWLPKQISQIWTEKGQEVGRTDTHMVEAAANNAIPDEQFRNIFPNGVEVWDTITDIRYIAGPGPSLGKVIENDLMARLNDKPAGTTATQPTTAALSAAGKPAGKTQPVGPALASAANPWAAALMRRSWWTIGFAACLCGSALALVAARRRNGGVR